MSDPRVFADRKVFYIPAVINPDWHPWDNYERATEQVLDREARALKCCAGPITFGYQPITYSGGGALRQPWFRTPAEAIEYTRQHPDATWQLACEARAVGKHWEETHGEG